MKNTQTLDQIAIGDLRASKTNPRKTFAPGPLKELADSILTQGIRQPILARPTWNAATPYEIVAGERRYRAAQLAGLATVPCLVQDMSDREALEVQVVENLQRSDLTEMEEAQSYQSMLELTDDAGAPVYTAELLAERFGKEKTHVYRRLALLRLIDTGREALASGQLGATAAVLVARIPSPEAQAEALKKILQPQFRQQPLNFAETRELIARDFLQGLKGAPFKLDDAALVPAAGACAACLKMSDNCAHLFSAEEAEQFKKKKVCTDPACYRVKLDALWKKRTEKAAAEGKTILDEKQSRVLFPDHVEEGAMAYNSPYVFLNEKPAEYLLKPEVVANVGTWRSLIDEAEKKSVELALAASKDKILADDSLSSTEKKDAIALLEKSPPEGALVPRILARDQTGSAREIVDRVLAMTIIEASGEPIFQGKVTGNTGGGVSQFDKERKAHVEAAKLRLAENIEAITRIHGELTAIWQPSGVWEGLFEVAMGHAGHDGVWLIAKWQGLKYQSEGTNLYDVVGGWAAGLPAEERQALVPLLLMGVTLKNSGPGEELETFAQACDIPCDLHSITKTAQAALKKVKPPKEAKAPKKTKAEQKAEADAAHAAGFEWNQAGVATKPDVEDVLGASDMPEGTKCEVAVAFAPDGFWRFGLDLQSRTEGKAAQGGLPSLAGEKFKTYDDAMVAGFHAALPFFKDDPAAFRVVARDCDRDVVEEIEGEGGGAPVTAKAPKVKRGKVTPEVEEQVKIVHEEGKPAQEIAKALGLSVPAVQNIKKKFYPKTPAEPAATEPAMPTIDIATAREQLRTTMAEVFAGATASVLAKILAKYAKRVGSKGSGLDDLTYAQIGKILEIFAQAKIGHRAMKTKVTTADLLAQENTA
jgi:ParB/RepB/Spo0J family partition protein